MTLVHRQRRRRPLRRWPRRILLAVNVVVFLCLITSGGVYAYVRTKIDSIRTITAPHLTPTVKGAPDSADGLAPENILLIGNETRAGLGTNAFGSQSEYTGTLSDVIMVLHLDPAKKTASLLSIPRDVFAPMPSGSEVGPYQKIDAALNDGTNGPDNLIAAIQQDWGIPINHYIELNFDGLQATVNALGGINVDFPEPLYDLESDLVINNTGCQHIDGATALALVRSRHLQYDPPGVDPYDHSAWPYDPESDLSRIVRDHTFLRILVATAETKGVSNPITANNFVDGLISQITIDPGLRNQLVPLISHYHSLNADAAPQTTIPVNTVGGSSGYSYDGAAIGDTEFANQPLDDQTIAAWDSSALPAAVAPTSVVVQEDNDSESTTALTVKALQADGLPISNTTYGSEVASPAPTWVDYPTNEEGEGIAVLDDLTGAAMLRPDPSLPSGEVQIELGTASSVGGAGAAVISSANSSSGTGSSSSSASSGESGSSASSGSSSGATTTTTTTTVPGQESTTSGGADLNPTPSQADDSQAPWDPRACS